MFDYLKVITNRNMMKHDEIDMDLWNIMGCDQKTMGIPSVFSQSFFWKRMKIDDSGPI